MVISKKEANLMGSNTDKCFIFNSCFSPDMTSSPITSMDADGFFIYQKTHNLTMYNKITNLKSNSCRLMG